jgi:hypothetical protein
MIPIILLFILIVLLLDKFEPPNHHLRCLA